MIWPCVGGLTRWFAIVFGRMSQSEVTYCAGKCTLGVSAHIRTRAFTSAHTHAQWHTVILITEGIRWTNNGRTEMEADCSRSVFDHQSPRSRLSEIIWMQETRWWKSVCDVSGTWGEAVTTSSVTVRQSDQLSAAWKRVTECEEANVECVSVTCPALFSCFLNMSNVLDWQLQ